MQRALVWYRSDIDATKLAQHQTVADRMGGLREAPARERLDHQYTEKHLNWRRGATVRRGRGKTFDEIGFDGLQEDIIVQKPIHLSQDRIHPHT